MPNYPVHGFGFGEAAKWIMPAMMQQQQDKKEQEELAKKEAEKQGDRQFQLATKVFESANNPKNPHKMREQGYMMAQETLNQIGVKVNFTPLMKASEATEEARKGFLNTMANQMDVYLNSTNPSERNKALVDLTNIDVKYRNFIGEESEYAPMIRELRTQHLKSLQAQQPVSPQELENITAKKQAEQVPLTSQAIEDLKTKRDINLSPRDQIFKQLSPAEQKEIVMRPERPEPKETGVLTEGTVKKSIDELAAFDMKTSAKLYKNYLTYRNAYTSKGLEISKAREQALSQVQQESQGISGTDNKKTYDYLWK